MIILTVPFLQLEKTRIAVLHYTEVGTKKLQFVNDYICFGFF